MVEKLRARLTSIQGKIVALALLALFSTSFCEAGETVIFSFTSAHGANSRSGLIADSNGNFYGTTTSGGAKSCGTVFELSPNSGGKWTETVLYSFTTCVTGEVVPPDPIDTLAIDKAGNLYGVWQSSGLEFGYLFELTKATDGTFSYSLIHRFNFKEGIPNGDLTWDSAGNLYGTTFADSTGFDGEVFEFSPQSDGTWKESVLYAFNYSNPVSAPIAGVVFDSKGNLYGPGYFGGNPNFGGVYELSHQANGTWKLIPIYRFTLETFGGPYSKLTFDENGNLYGTAWQAGSQFFGEVYKLSPTKSGQWKETTIHTFTSGSDGARPQGALVFDSEGNLYGSTMNGGVGCSASLCGTVYKLTPQTGGSWKETILHQFESTTDGSQPQQGLLLDSSGSLYGTTYYGGGRYGYGTVYQIIP
ncbi:MAG: choice-of-anchor tandem repeat GloVer-containing protein [Candidatus Sulfotelmatobacter sp.]